MIVVPIFTRELQVSRWVNQITLLDCYNGSHEQCSLIQQPFTHKLEATLLEIGAQPIGCFVTREVLR